MAGQVKGNICLLSLCSRFFNFFQKGKIINLQVMLSYRLEMAPSSKFKSIPNTLRKQLFRPLLTVLACLRLCLSCWCSPTRASCHSPSTAAVCCVLAWKRVLLFVLVVWAPFFNFFFPKTKKEKTRTKHTQRTSTKQARADLLSLKRGEGACSPPLPILIGSAVSVHPRGVLTCFQRNLRTVASVSREAAFIWLREQY